MLSFGEIQKLEDTSFKVKLHSFLQERLISSITLSQAERYYKLKSSSENKSKLLTNDRCTTSREKGEASLTFLKNK